MHRAESRIVLGEWAAAWGPSLARCSSPSASSCPARRRPGSTTSERDWREIACGPSRRTRPAALGTGGTELPAAVRAGRQLVRLVPLRESGYQVLMRALAGQGNVGRGARVYADLCDVLRDELGVSPSAATQAVYQSLLRS